MIKNFLHKGLKKLYSAGHKSGIDPTHERKLRLILSRLDSIHKPEDMNLPGFNFHRLTGSRKDEYAVKVDKNWRIIFKFDGIDVIDVDYVDYH
ncbi:MAG: type II toxin-antitoxin system RelE/ParE family toxin [Gammaproteobacteria bacterium]|nr:type II toxin-antitoxin system RelE/ParE family toxin [Gammaproteobacteria bacterium]